MKQIQENQIMHYSVHTLIPELSSRWDEYVAKQTNASVYHLSAWKILIERTFHHQCFYLYALDQQGEICGVLPCVNLNSKLFGNYMVSMPYFNYGGVLADNQLVADLLNNELQNVAKKQQVSHIQYREQIERVGSGLAVSTDKVNMVLRLPESADALGKAIGSKRRSQIKRPIREGVSHEIGGIELLADFYQVFSEHMRDLGTPVYSKDFFQAILTTFPAFCTLVVVYWQGKPVSSGFLIRYQDRMEIPWASTLNCASHISVNMYLYWEILSYAIETGCTEFDFGRSTVDQGTYKFKKQWGAEPLQCYWYYWLPEGGTMPNLSPSNKKFKLAIHIWQKLPLFMTNRIGPLLVKNLP
jgi:serine/alanine adding enzyme